MKIEEIVEGIEIGCQTLVGSWGDFPRSRGNCFDMKTTNGSYYRIVNFNVENLEELKKRGLEFPVKLLPLSEHVAIVCDERISDKWYDKDYCTVCCPNDLLSHHQRARHLRQEMRGDRKIIKGEKIDMIRMKVGESDNLL